MRTKPAAQLRYFRQQRSAILDTIEQLVTLESPSDVKAAIDRVSTVLASRFGELGGKVTLHKAEKFGNHLQVEFRGERLPHFSQKKRREMGHPQKPILLLGHMDTVYPVGTISKMPFRVSKGRVWGPGVFDMKSGIALTWHVLEALLQWHDGVLPRPVTVLLVSDEEVGSTSSRQITEKLAKQSEAVLVLEPAAGPKGAVKTARKGIGDYTVRVEGVPAHSGLDFEKGHSAVVELSRQILRLSEMVDLKRGTTINVGKISGGGRVNVVPAEASAIMDLRVRTKKDADHVHRQLMSLRPFDRQCKVKVTGGLNRPPMERTAAGAALYKKAAHVANELGWKLEEASVGGGSDGNFTAALGIPTLDGLGAVGDGAHAEHESVVISELPKRAALLAGLISSLNT
ncbi:MAG TPA: M20 family metallopeptidase [Terriglobales bacterium]|nr:M20 family metallopeptidase [Terriglobales bacterium]